MDRTIAAHDKKSTGGGLPLQAEPSRDSAVPRETQSAIKSHARIRPGCRTPGTLSLMGNDSWRLKSAEAVLPESGWVFVKDVERLRRHYRPRPLPHFKCQLPRSPPGRSGKSPEGVGRVGLCHEAFQNRRRNRTSSRVRSAEAPPTAQDQPRCRPPTSWTRGLRPRKIAGWCCALDGTAQ